MWRGAHRWEGAATRQFLPTPPELPRSEARHTPHTAGTARGAGHPPARADGGTLTHGELRCSDPVASLPMPRTRAQCGGMDAVALNDNAVTDTADMLQRQLTLAGGDVEELEEVAAEDAAQSDWAELPDELVEKVLELLQAAGRSEPQDEGLGFFRATATMRLVCAAWKAVHDALVTRLVLRRQTTDEATGMLVLRFPAVASLEVNDTQRRC